MQISIQVQEFREALNKILSVVDKRNTRQILNYVQIHADNNQLELTATDLEVSAKIILKCDVNNSGYLCVNAKNIFDIIKELPDKKVDLQTDDQNNNLKISCENINFTLLIYPIEDFPQLQFKSISNEFKLSAHQILDIINKTSHAISTDETRLFLNGIFLQNIDGKLRSVSTDGFRLALIETHIDTSKIEALTNGIIIPRKAVLELKKITDAYPNDEIHISVDDSFIYLNANESYFLSVRLIAKEYLRYQAVIPKKTNFYVDIDRNQFINAVKRIKIMANERSNGVKVIINQNELTVMAHHSYLGEASEKLPISFFENKFEIGFNAKFLIESLTSFNEDEIRIEFNNELSPVVIKPLKNQHFLCVIMPLKL